MAGLVERLLTAELFALVLIFARVGSAMMLLPGFAENSVPVRVRLMLAMAITLVVAPMLAPGLPRLPGNPINLALLLMGEIGIGLFIGTMARLLLSALEIAGMVIALQIGLASAVIFNPLLNEQGSLTGIFLMLLGITLLFEVDAHHLMLRGVFDSYTLFVPNALPPIGDFTELLTRLVGQSFKIGLQMAAPFLLVMTMLYIALALVSRLMPQLQIFFLALPLQLLIGILLLGATVSSIMLLFLDTFAATFRGLLRPT